MLEQSPKSPPSPGLFLRVTDKQLTRPHHRRCSLVTCRCAREGAWLLHTGRLVSPPTNTSQQTPQSRTESPAVHEERPCLSDTAATAVLRVPRAAGAFLRPSQVRMELKAAAEMQGPVSSPTTWTRSRNKRGGRLTCHPLIYPPRVYHLVPTVLWEWLQTLGTWREQNEQEPVFLKLNIN